jgi:hypothetical protein
LRNQYKEFPEWKCDFRQNGQKMEEEINWQMGLFGKSNGAVCIDIFVPNPDFSSRERRRTDEKRAPFWEPSGR